MSTIVLEGIVKFENVIKYSFSVSFELCSYFSGREFWIEYPESVECVPDSVLAIPFVCNVLPIVWITNSRLVVPELDEEFYECLPEVRRGYESMYPETDWGGEVVVGSVIRHESHNTGKTALFFSGGLDSTYTLVSHLEEKPTLISIWGSDITVGNELGWETLHRAIARVAERFGLDNVVVQSNFREFDDEGELSRRFSEQLKDGWWHGAKHGIALLGHVAPIAYSHDLNRLYIASSHSPADGHVRCASNPIIDNNVRYASCRVVHDGFEFDRQSKTESIVRFSSDNGPIKLHVCWQSQSGNNCCRCEKCFRTIIGIIVEGANPTDYGFCSFGKYIGQSQMTVIENVDPNLCKEWVKIRRRMMQSKDSLRDYKYWKAIKWVLNTDFEHPGNLRLPYYLRLKKRLAMKTMPHGLCRKLATIGQAMHCD